MSNRNSVRLGQGRKVEFLSSDEFLSPFRVSFESLYSSFLLLVFLIAPAITLEEEWEAMLPEVRAAMQQLCQPVQEGEEEVLEVEETLESTSEQITGLLRKLNYK